tara:strand:- start:19 stop:855 length:837 start_codon:yes stop_codon:yes gene_type:complete
MENNTLTISQSYPEFIEFMRTAKMKDNKMDASIDDDFAFTGSNSFDEAIELAVNGWDEGRSDLASAAEYAFARTQTIDKPQWNYAPAGAIPNVPAAAAGVPSNMMTLHDSGTNSKQPIVTIYASFGASYMVSSEAIIRRGAAIVALIDQIEQSGKRVKLVCYCSNLFSGARVGEETYDRLIYTVTAKESDELLDLDRIAFTMAHPSMLRRCKFRVMECTFDNYIPGYGAPSEMPNDLREANAMHLGPMYSDDGFETQEQAIETIQKEWEASSKLADAA